MSHIRAKLGAFPPHSAALFVASLAFIADAPQISFLENPQLRNYGNVLIQGRGLWPRPENRRNYSAYSPHAAASFVASLAFIADAPQISFLRYRELRNKENALTQGKDLGPRQRKSAKLRASPPHYAAFFRGFIGFHSRRATN